MNQVTILLLFTCLVSLSFGETVSGAFVTKSSLNTIEVSYILRLYFFYLTSDSMHFYRMVPSL